MKNKNYLHRNKKLRMLLEYFYDYFVKFVEKNKRNHEVYSIYKDDITFHMVISEMRNQGLINYYESKMILNHLEKHRIVLISMFQNYEWESHYNLRIDVLKIRIWKLKKIEKKFNSFNQLCRNYKAFVLKMNKIYMQTEEPNFWI